MTENYQGIWRGAPLRECPVCSAAVTDAKTHSDWHERLRQALAGDGATVDVVDEDR